MRMNYISIIFFLFLFSTVKLSAQQFNPQYNIPVGANCNGFYEYLPLGYNPAAAQKYPLIIAAHGVGERGDGSSNATGLPRLIVPGKGMASLIFGGGFPASFIYNSTTYRFLVICPQFLDNGSAWPNATDLDAVVTYALNNYKVDLNRVYITGLSMGGGLSIKYVTNSATNANKVAALVTVCPAIQPGPPYAAKPDSLPCRTITSANLPVWATHNLLDNVVPKSFTDSFVHYINAAPSPTPLARKTIFPTSPDPHDAWTRTYDPLSTDFDGTNMYLWMLQYQRSITPLPVNLINYKAYKSGAAEISITWQTASEFNNDHFTLERSNNGVDFNSIAVVAGLNRSNIYLHKDKHPVAGDNYYRLSQTDKDGRTANYDILRVRLNGFINSFTLGANPVKNTLLINIESEEKGMITASIINTSGSVVKQLVFNKQNGQMQQQVSVSDLANGIYLIQFKGKNFVETLKFLKN